jgi:rubrerythrin
MKVLEPVDFGALDCEERSRLMRAAAEVCVSRLRAIADAADPKDRALHRLLEELEAEARRQLQRVGGGEKTEAVPIEPFFPSLRWGFGEGWLDRESALHFAECLQEEAFRFYRTLAETAPDESERAALNRAALTEWGRLERLRSVLL